MYRERQPVREELEGPQSPDQSRIAPRIYPALRSIASAPDLEARSEPKRPSRTDPREMPVEIEARHHSDSGRRPRLTIRNVLLGLGLIAGLGTGAWYGDYWWTVGRFIVSTDDAYVGAHAAALEAKVSGYMSTIDFDDNAHVRAGDVIARIDDGDYQLAVQTAKDNIATEQATINRIQQQISAQEAAVNQAKAQLDSAIAGQTRAELELKRQQELATRQFASQQTLEQAQQNRDQAIAAVHGAQAGIQTAEANVAVLKAQQNEAANTLKQYQTALAKAERDLSFTIIRAPFDGVMGNRSVQVGDYVQPGQRLASLVPLDAVYIDANFKETQLVGLAPGEHVAISVDALPNRTIDGTVVSFAPASGSVFSLLPPDNATGNFTKIVQRVAVRIAVPADVAREAVLRPGLSVVASINTKPSPITDSRIATR
jgi:membrane fusion protein, multidrug efflux system